MLKPWRTVLAVVALSTMALAADANGDAVNALLLSASSPRLDLLRAELIADLTEDQELLCSCGVFNPHPVRSAWTFDDGEVEGSLREYARANAGWDFEGRLCLPLETSDLFEPCRFSLIANTPIVRSEGEFWANRQSHLPAGRARNWVGVRLRDTLHYFHSRGPSSSDGSSLAGNTNSDGDIHAAVLILSEPSSLIMLGLGLLLAGAVFHRRRPIR